MIRSSLAALSVLAAVGCSGRGGGEYVGEPAGPMRAVLRPVNTPVTGDALVRPGPRPGTFTVALSILGSQGGQQHPWHVHGGRCEAPEDIIGSVIAYRPMMIRGDGQFDLEATIDAQLRPGRAYHVDVHASPTQLDRVIACGDLLPE